MQQISQLIPGVPERVSPSTETSYEEYLQRQCRLSNEVTGTLKDYDCPECLNRGGSYIVKNNAIVFRPCKCEATRRTIRHIEKSGLRDLLDECSLESFEVREPWQDDMKHKALSFLDDCTGKWFYVGGQVGSGKTHICTALVGAMMKSGMAARYMKWKDESTRLKAIVTDEARYSREIGIYKEVAVLYIDDFFKIKRVVGEQVKPPSQGDINIAFEILNYRYINKSLVTIISSEHFIDELMDFDEATGSRIYQRSKDYCNIITREKKRNYRMR